MKNSKENDAYENARMALLRYYNSQCMTHGGYLIAILIGLLTIISRWDAFTANIVVGACFWFIVFCLIVLCAYIIYRIFWWGYFASEVLHVGKKDIAEQKMRQIRELLKGMQIKEEQKRKQIEEEEQKKMQIPMSILHKATSHEVIGKHRLTGVFYKGTNEAVKKISKKLRKNVRVYVCPECKNWVRSEWNFCRECGTNLQPKKTT